MIGRTNSVGGGVGNFDPECIGTVGQELYVYHDTTIEAGDFIKFTEGIGTVEESEGGEYQTHDLTKGLYSGGQFNPTGTFAYDPKLKRLDENTVVYVRNISTGATSNPDSNAKGYGVTIGTIDSTGISIEWGTEIIISPSTYVSIPWECGADVCSIGNNRFIIVTPLDHNEYLVRVYSYSGNIATLVKSTTIELSWGVTAVPRIYGLTYFETGKAFLIVGHYYYDSTTNTTTAGVYGQIISVIDSGACSAGTLYGFANGSSMAGAPYPTELQVGSYFVFANSTNTSSVYLTISGGAISVKKYNLKVLASQGFYYDSDRQILVGVTCTRSVSDGVGTFTFTIREYVDSGSTLTLNNNTYTSTIEIPVNDTTTSLQGHKLISEMPGLYLGHNCGYVHMGVLIANLTNDSYWTTYYFTGLSFILKYTESGYEVVDFRHKYYTGERRLLGVATVLSETRVVTGSSHMGESSGTYASDGSAIETVIEGVNPQGFNFNTYTYENQVIKAESNDDIKGVAITSGVGGTETQHNDMVRIRQNV